MTRDEALKRADEVVLAYVRQQPIGRESPHRLLVEYVADAIEYGWAEALRRAPRAGAGRDESSPQLTQTPETPSCADSESSHRPRGGPP